jgi:hypothetical protein
LGAQRQPEPVNQTRLQVLGENFVFVLVSLSWEGSAGQVNPDIENFLMSEVASLKQGAGAKPSMYMVRIMVVRQTGTIAAPQTWSYLSSFLFYSQTSKTASNP